MMFQAVLDVRNCRNDWVTHHKISHITPPVARPPSDDNTFVIIYRKSCFNMWLVDIQPFVEMVVKFVLCRLQCRFCNFGKHFMLDTLSKENHQNNTIEPFWLDLFWPLSLGRYFTMSWYHNKVANNLDKIAKTWCWSWRTHLICLSYHLPTLLTPMKWIFISYSCGQFSS